MFQPAFGVNQAQAQTLGLRPHYHVILDMLMFSALSSPEFLIP